MRPWSRVLELFLTRADEAALLAGLDVTLLENKDRSFRIAPKSSAETQWWIPTLPIETPIADPKQLPPLIQFLRCQIFPSCVIEGRPELRQGRVAIVTGSRDPAVAATVRKVWMAIKKLTTNEVNRINPVAGTNYGRDGTIFVGPDAAQWARDGNLLSGNAANIYYAPA